MTGVFVVKKVVNKFVIIIVKHTFVTVLTPQIGMEIERKRVHQLDASERKELLESIKSIYKHKIPYVLYRKMVIPMDFLRGYHRKYTTSVLVEVKAQSAHDLLLSFDLWDQTPQGVEFWSDIAEKFKNGQRPNNNTLREVFRKHKIT